MQSSKTKRPVVLLGFAIVGWVFCASIMGGLPPLVGMSAALRIHLVAGPVGFALLAAFYQRRFGDYTPLTVATVFIGFVMAMDFFLVALVILRNMEMFHSPIGTWIPFALIFLTSYVSGVYARRR